METAGAPPPAAAASPERVIPAFKPPDILWYFGTFATAFATYLVISKIPNGQRDVWELLVSLGFFAAYAVASLLLVRSCGFLPGSPPRSRWRWCRRSDTRSACSSGRIRRTSSSI